MSAALDVAVGMAFLYLLLALMVTTLQELIASLLRLRAKHLYRAITDMLEAGDRGLALKVYRHTLVRNLTQSPPSLERGAPSWLGSGLPSYIPSRTFAIVLLDVLRHEKGLSEAVGASRVLGQADQYVDALPDGKLRQALQLLVGDAQALGDSVESRARVVSERIETWFNERMARASGWYKRSAQVWSLVIAAVVTLIANADSIHVVQRLWSDSDLRSAVAATAQAYDGAHAREVDGQPSVEPAELQRHFAEQMRRLESGGLPIGWAWESSGPCARRDASQPGKPCWDASIGNYLTLLVGWIVSALAVSLGAAFWFDVLSKALQLRGSGPRVSPVTGRVES